MANRKEQTAISINKPLRDELRGWKELGESWDYIIEQLMDCYKKVNQPKDI